jgi:hypothetical protein
MVWALLYSAPHIVPISSAYHTIPCRPGVKLESSFGISSTIEFKYRGICLRPVSIYGTRPSRPAALSKQKTGVALLKSGYQWSWHGDPLVGVRALSPTRGGELLHLSSLGIDDRLCLLRSVPSVRGWPLTCVFLWLVFEKARSVPRLSDSTDSRKFFNQGGRGLSHTARIHVHAYHAMRKKAKVTPSFC